jgi:hypothetical protein
VAVKKAGQLEHHIGNIPPCYDSGSQMASTVTAFDSGATLCLHTVFDMLTGKIKMAIHKRSNWNTALEALGIVLTVLANRNTRTSCLLNCMCVYLVSGS